jgi:hypothetical protein
MSRKKTAAAPAGRSQRLRRIFALFRALGEHTVVRAMPTDLSVSSGLEAAAVASSFVARAHVISFAPKKWTPPKFLFLAHC